MTEDEMRGLDEFWRAAGALKDTLRSGHTPDGRRESTAEHSWRLALIAMTLEGYAPQFDALEVMKLCLVHDLGEALTGDVPATEQANVPDRTIRERRDLAAIAEPAPAAVRSELLRLFDDYCAARTPEARLVKALDKLETLITHGQGANPPGFDYAFNLGYGRDATDACALTAALRRLADDRTRARMVSEAS